MTRERLGGRDVAEEIENLSFNNIHYQEDSWHMTRGNSQFIYGGGILFLEIHAESLELEWYLDLPCVLSFIPFLSFCL